jgi:hypothetical protein
VRRETAWSAIVSACHELGPDELSAVALVARRMGRIGRGEGKLPRRAADRPRCGARCRSKGGAPCVAPVMVRWYADRAGQFTVPKLATRCRMHGGLSTGPKTPEGLRRCVEAGRIGAATRWGRCHDPVERIDSGALDVMPTHERAEEKRLP